MAHFQNPIIPGFYPDPSICRVGEDYYLCTSTFEFFPGVPIFHSRDLAHWEQIGHALTRVSQLPLADARPSGGIYAPTLRHHNGCFYMVTTNVSHGGNFYVSAEDPAGEWSEPLYVQQGGIDPSLLFDDDGKVYFTSTVDGGIHTCEIELSTGKMLTPPVRVWNGTGGRFPEAPHLYKINGMYYLMIAEGGTETGHMETIARSATPYGPWESCPFNPILTHRDQGGAQIQATGHADLVCCPDGSWYAVFLAFRQSVQYFHHLGRETYLAPVTWKDGWPLIGTCPEQGETTLPDAPVPTIPTVDTFATRRMEWVCLRKPDNTLYAFGKDGLTLTGAKDTLCGYNPTMLMRRQQHFDLRAETVLTAATLPEGCEAGLTTYYDLNTHYELYLTQTRFGRRVQVRRIVGDLWMLAADVEAPQGEITLGIRADKLQYTFLMNNVPLCTAMTRYVSTESTPCSFTGVMLGLYVVGEGANATFRSFTYLPQ